MFILSNYIESDPGFIVGPISSFLGIFIDIIFNFVFTITENQSLGITIIFFTIFIRLLMLPLGYKQQKSMFVMKKLQPEIKKIQEKYGDSKTPEDARNMQIELTEFYRKNNYNPFSGCLPLLVQMPIFIALYFLMKNSYLFITELGDVYNSIATYLQSQPNFVEVVVPLATPLVPDKMTIDIAIVEDFAKVINKFSVDDWAIITSQMPQELIGLLERKESIEYFAGINLIEVVGFRFPQLILVILSAITSYLSSFVMMKMNPPTDPAMATQQKVMSIVMPIMMAFITIGIPCGVAIYWCVGNVLQIFQQIFLTKYCEKKFV